MAFSNPDRIRNILSGAGFTELTIDTLETKIPVAADVPASVQKLLEVGPVSRLLREVSDDVTERIANDLFDAISGFQTDGGVMIDSATWIVSAVSP